MTEDLCLEVVILLRERVRAPGNKGRFEEIVLLECHSDDIGIELTLMCGATGCGKSWGNRLNRKENTIAS